MPKNRFLTISLITGLIVLMMAACSMIGGSRGQSESLFAAQIRSTSQPIMVNASRIWPAYGLKVRADVAVLRLELTTTAEETTASLTDLQQALDDLASLAAEDEAIELISASVNQLGNLSDRSLSDVYSDGLDTPAITLKLSTPLAASQPGLLPTLTLFNDFLAPLTLPATVSVQGISLETEISDPEQYRQQIISQVYQELNARQQQSGEAVQFEISGLHTTLQTIQLSDIDYYLYLEPTITGRQ